MYIVRHRLLAILLLIAAVALAGCSFVGERPAGAEPSWNYPTAEPLQAAAPVAPYENEAQPTPTKVPPTPTTAPTATLSVEEQAAAPSPTPTPEPLGLAIGDDSGVFWADPLSGETIPLVAEPLSTSWSLSGQHLALVHGRSVETVDLTTGQSQMISTDMPDSVVEMQAFWARESQRLLLAGWVEPDPASDEPTQQLLLQEWTDGGLTPLVTYEGLPAMILGYAQGAGSALLWRPAADGLALLTVNPSTGAIDATATLPALAELSLGPDGRVAALAGAGDGYALITTTLSAPEQVSSTPLEAGTYATELSWSPDGQRLAFLLHRGALYDPEVEDLGLYVLDLATDEMAGPLSDILPYARIAGWEPDSGAVILHDRGLETQTHAYVGLDGAGARLLPIPGSATVLGWLSRPALTDETLTLDPWRGRFVAASDDAQATAQAAGSFVAGNPGQSLADREAQLKAYYVAAGWPQADYALLALADDVYALAAPPNSIVFVAQSGAQIIGQGDTLRDARLSGEQAAVIWSTIVGETEQWTAALLTLTDGAWSVSWQPLGDRAWITTNGAVQFGGEGLETLSVSGTSLGLPSGAFVECATCPLRELRATWRLEEKAYVRETELDAEASIDDVYWEMTERTPYALVYETMRRLRAGEDIGKLTRAAAERQFKKLELDAADLRLVVDQADAEAVVFGPAESSVRYRAVANDEQIVSIEIY